MTSSSWNSFEHKLWGHFKEFGVESSGSYVLAVSGGLDSMALLSVFSRLLPQAKVKVAYYHHGPSEVESQNQYRQQALEHVRQKVDELSLSGYEFVTEGSQQALVSEQEMRDARWAFLNRLAQEGDGAVIVTGHHWGDHFETVLLKMIRGTSLEGVSAFKMWQKGIFRPLLNCTKDELMSYVRDRGFLWVEDPSNQDEDYLRNWLRENWLKSLEAKVTGGPDNLARSLFKIISSAESRGGLELVFAKESKESAEGLSREWYLGLTKAEQLTAIALFLKKHQIYQFTSGQLEEIRKRLDKNQKDFTFELLRRKWVINASQIMLQ
ncbi:tRNA lysidine(34) synthetase TilS [Pseudobdellovibrio exovorus]|uniref:tRNA(Ile)-lysidine synthase n=1 Tax=Pseudobdellovibrio exovorus JSS TaxID=1184267 RepID=M4VAU3_9BACT|nr:tRNA lysidine(34) synthetase TilS [Pseudobdellovibrio exovorus]AGH95590.1 putative cell cycle protein [Pseudobdellovibrio exovorus JSS]